MIDYPAPFEILLSVADEDDPAIEIAKKILNEFPDIDATLFIGE